ncbi:MAG TPA: hypothetical protein VG013_42100 [Gemmataceae bacterium]|jgi:hypothetical protein|nr:hypothetical protein [Gemmataceae bacterium]
MTCEQYRDLLNRHLDGEPVDETLTDHSRQCPDCAALLRGAQRLAQALPHLKPPAPAGYLTNNILLELRDDRRRRLALRLRIIASAVAAAALLAIGITSFWPAPKKDTPLVVRNTQPAMPETTVTLRDTVDQAGQAVGQLTARTANETVGSFWEVLTPPHLNDWDTQPQIEPPTQPLKETGQSAVVAIEPVTNSARRAFGMLLRDMPPMDQPAKPDS